MMGPMSIAVCHLHQVPPASITTTVSSTCLPILPTVTGTPELLVVLAHADRRRPPQVPLYLPPPVFLSFSTCLSSL